MGHFFTWFGFGVAGTGVVDILFRIVVRIRIRVSHDASDRAAWRRYRKDEGTAVIGICLGVVALTFPTHFPWWRWALIGGAVFGFLMVSQSYVGTLRQSLADNRAARDKDADEQRAAEAERAAAEEVAQQVAAQTNHILGIVADRGASAAADSANWKTDHPEPDDQADPDA